MWNKTSKYSDLLKNVRAVKLKSTLLLLVAKYKSQWEMENTSKRTGAVAESAKRKMPKMLRLESQLTDDDWATLTHIERILSVFEDVVRGLEGDGHIRKRRRGWTGSYGNIWDVIIGFETLLSMMEYYKTAAEDFPSPEQFRIGLNNAWQKLDEYYRKLDETPIYYVSVVLHPAYRWDYLEETWARHPNADQWLHKAKDYVRGVWLTGYSHLPVSDNAAAESEPPAKRRCFRNPFDKAQRTRSAISDQATLSGSATPLEPEVDEYSAWLEDTSKDDNNVVDPIK
ncbi:hypothetical protein O1611_g4924 [Lasiodiplodia mahajangana]|uniref:Uncharacterized protein n=1 Tax=Lasiodiplodia mahajangana TaxID=1108764 RepID=A0ACC2JN81_9PEZI|nr:hypothetical protein O1611_g4924 [Lasiodiplodia mahajangana]